IWQRGPAGLPPGIPLAPRSASAPPRLRGGRHMIELATMAARLAAQNAGAPALIDPNSGTTRTFGDPGRRPRQLSAALFEELGVRPGTRVVAMARNSLEMVELYLACARTGA